MKHADQELLSATNQYLVMETMNEHEKSSWQLRLPKTIKFACIYNIATEFGISKKLNELEKLKAQIFVEGENAVDDDLLSIAGRRIRHPYWSKYAQLVSLKTANLAPTALKQRIKQLMIGLNFKDRLVVKTLITLPWFKVSMIEETFFHVLRQQFAYSVWSPKILQFLCSYSPLIELGAGNGYNAWLLQQSGAEVIALDAYPIEEGGNWFFQTRFSLPSRAGKSWTTVQKGTSTELLNYPNHTLLLCWPPINSMGAKALSNYPGKRIIFIGNKKCCATSKFYKSLQNDWILEYAETTGSWHGCHTEWLEVYTRKLVKQ